MSVEGYLIQKAKGACIIDIMLHLMELAVAYVKSMD